MTVKPEDIRARVDGELDQAQARCVDNALLADKRLQQTAEKLRASQLPYREAYNEAPLPDIPDTLRARIEAMRNPDAQSSSVQDTPAQSPKYQDASIQTLPADAANNSWFMPAGIAASVMIAAMVGYLAGGGPATQ